MLLDLTRARLADLARKSGLSKSKVGRVSKLSQPSGNPNSIDGNGNSRKWIGRPDLIDPPSSITLFATSPNPFTFSLLSTPSIPKSITFKIAFFTSSLFTFTPNFSSSPQCTTPLAPTPTPTPNTSTTNFSFKNWSANCGHVTMGTPPHTPSSIEFHPQCVKNPPTEGWDNIKTCGAHPRIKNPSPLSLILSSNPLSTTHFSTSLFLITQMNG
ncbi:hypothetical protein LXL04_005087 [Taraxacum kok-saghyz]